MIDVKGVHAWKTDEHDWIVQAFVQEDFEKDILRKLPIGCDDLPGKQVRLKKRMYGLKQGSCIWHAPLITYLKSL